MKNSKFVPLYETIYNRFKQGSGFLEGDVVKLKSNFKSTEGYKALPETIKQRLEDISNSEYNLRLGRLHSPHNQYGSYGHLNLPATHADLYQEVAPGNFGNLVTVPLDLLEEIDTGVNLPSVSPKNKRTANEAPYQKPTKKGTNKDPMTDEQTKTGEKQNYTPKGDYELATKNKKLPNSNDYDDEKPSKFKPLEGNQAKPKTLEEAYDTIWNEDVAVSAPDVTEGSEKLLLGKRQKVTEDMVKPECWDRQNQTAIGECWNEDGSLKQECWSNKSMA